MTKCSFCKGLGHNIRECKNTETVLEKFALLYSIYISREITYTRHNFTKKLNKIFNLNEIKIISINIAGSYASLSKQQHVTIILDKLFPLTAPLPTPAAAQPPPTPPHTHRVTDLNECSICLDTDIHKDKVIQLKCTHQFCVDCVVSTIQSTTLRNNCPLCREPITHLYTTNNIETRNKINFCVR